jgi:hypothetical protein
MALNVRIELDYRYKSEIVVRYLSIFDAVLDLS